MFQRLSGMFAFAIYDFNKQMLVLARDRMGEKPMYYGKAGDTIIFGSELKALLAHPQIIREIDLHALKKYLTFDYVPSPFTIFNNIYKLEPGSYLTFHGHELTIKKYWDITFSHQVISFEEACEEFSQRLERAVATKLIADVPLGFFLSGGLDSSTVAYFGQKNSMRQIHTYSIGFENKSYDESKYSKKVAKLIGSYHQHEILTERDTLNLIPLIGEKVDEPFADPSIIPTYLLTNFTRKHVTVSLGGDGSDELLGGYPTFLADRFLGVANMFSSVSKPLMDLALRILPVSDRNIGLDFKIQQFQKGINVPADETHTMWLSSFTPRFARSLLNKNAADGLNDEASKVLAYHLRDFRSDSRFNRNSMIYLKTYLPDDILFKVDRASMLASLEVRSPFLDHTFVDFVNSLPESYKRKGLNTKRILKKSMEGKLPDNIIYRPKKGFGIPLSLWLRRELKNFSDELLSERELSIHGLFNYPLVKKLKEDHECRRRNNRKEIWNLMMFQLWYQNFFAR